MFTYQAKVEHIDNSITPIALTMDCCVAAGYTGRNREKVQAHIDELNKLGVTTPYDIPALYWISPTRLSNHEELVVVGNETSPEVEFFIGTDQEGNLYVTVASDHTDRELETVSVGKSKQVCDKILGDLFWKVEDTAEHWDEIQLESQVLQEGRWITYQSGTLADIMHYQELLELIGKDLPAGEAPALLSGTLPLKEGETIYSTGCIIKMSDPVLKRQIVKQYTVTVLPDRS